MGIASEMQAVVDNIKETRENVLKSKKKLKEYVKSLISNEKERLQGSRGDFKEAHNIWQSLIKDKKNVKSKKRKAKK